VAVQARNEEDTNMTMNSKWVGVAALGAVMVVSGACSTKRYAREQAAASANELAVKMNEKDTQLQAGIEANGEQITELSGVTREHDQKITALDSTVKTVDQKAGTALQTGQAAQSAADKANSQIAMLDEKFSRPKKMEVVEEVAIPFKFDSAKLDPAHDARLADLVQKLKSNQEAVLVLEGRTDSTGNDQYNIELGNKRVAAIERYLVVNSGVPIHQVYKMSFGADNPIAENTSREGREKNRVVVLRLLAPAAGDSSLSTSTATSR
jgi:outer membrane protein OmpA-like peptidoglycan-associated protein